MHTHYDNLKVVRSAPPEVIKAAYRALSQRYHPDRNPGPDAERVMRILNDAYAVLGDPERRAAYDRELAADERAPSSRAWASADARPAARPAGDGGEGAAVFSAASSARRLFAAAAASAQKLQTPVAPALGISVCRCFARLFDLGWEAGALGAAVALLLGAHCRAFSVWLSEPGNPALFAMLCLPVAMVVDASVYYVAGNTPGKALLGLKITTLDGGRLSWPAYVRRNLAVWARGLGCGIPLVSLIAMWRRAREASVGADVSYDMKTGHQVSAAPIGVVRKMAFGVLSVGLVAVAVAPPPVRPAGGPQGGHPSPPAVAMAAPSPVDKKGALPPPRASSWINPMTGGSATLDGLWRRSSFAAADRGTVYSFSARDGHTTVLFAAQDAPAVSMGDYVLAYLRGNAFAMNLSPPDAVDHADGIDTWTADGHLNAKPAVAIHVELRHIGASYWRMVVMRSPRVPLADEGVGRLVQRLWATVPSA
jgi:hypothetical protein